MKLKTVKATALLCASICAVAPVAALANGSGFYAGLAGAVADVQKTDYAGIVEINSPSPAQAPAAVTEVPFGGKIGLKSSGEIRASVGYDFGLIRADVEVSYTRSRIKTVSLTSYNGAPSNSSNQAGFGSYVCGALFEDGTCTQSGGTVSVKGGSKVRQINALANVWVDLPVAERFHPYVGGGLGVAGFESEGEGRSVFAWQVGAGLAYDVTPHVALTLDYRHRQTSRLKDAFDIGADLGRAKVNTYGAGVRFSF
jgi:opacity protein-like surface antigen